MAFTSNVKQVTATIKKVDGRTLRNSIQTAALHVIGHAMQFGHSPLAGVLADQMQLAAMTRKVEPMLIKFITKNGPFNYSKDTGYVFSKAKRDAMNEDNYDFDELVLTAPQWDDQPKEEKKADAYDAFKALEKLVKQAETKITAGDCISADLVPYMKALLGQYAGRKLLAEAMAAAKADAVVIRADELEAAGVAS